MRCQNCGWNNQPNVTVCTKCGQALPINTVSPVVDNHANHVEEFSADRATMIFKKGQIPTHQQLQTESVAQQITNCSVCGYPVAGNDANCPACGAPLSHSQAEVKVEIQPIVHTEQPTVRFKSSDLSTVIQSEKEVSVQQTVVQPKTHIEQPTVHFKSSEISNVVEVKKEEPITPSTPQGILVPIREITQPEFPKLVCEDGKWYVEPIEKQSIYLQIVRRIEIKPGDIVMIGGRQFRFEETTI